MKIKDGNEYKYGDGLEIIQVVFANIHVTNVTFAPSVSSASYLAPMKCLYIVDR